VLVGQVGADLLDRLGPLPAQGRTVGGEFQADGDPGAVPGQDGAGVAGDPRLDLGAVSVPTIASDQLMGEACSADDDPGRCSGSPRVAGPPSA
jgi:hypothetical protein